MSSISPSILPSTDIEAPVGPRPRVRSGCLTCRKRKVKCDEQRPNCHNCTRLKRGCIYARTSNLAQNITVANEDTRKSVDSDVADVYGINVTVTTASSTAMASDSLLSTSANFDANDAWDLPLDLLETNTDLSFQQSTDTLGLFQSSASPALSWSQVALMNEPSMHQTQSLSNASYSVFLDEVQPPFISSVDGRNWKTMKQHFVAMARYHTVVSQAISAFAAIYKATIERKDTLSSMSSYYTAKSGYANMLEQDGHQPEHVLVVAFLLCCFEVVAQHDTVPITLKPEGALILKLESCIAGKVHMWTPLMCRLRAWFQILQAKTVHLGGSGILSPKVSILLGCNGRISTPILHQPDNLDHEEPLCPQQAILSDLANQLFGFYLDVQLLSTRVSCLNRHHRSRGFQEDEQEVEMLAQDLQQTLGQLWRGRPGLLRTDRTQLRQTLGSEMHDTLGRLSDICIVAFYTEIVYLGRAYGKTLTASEEALDAMNHIHCIINSYHDQYSALDPAFLWPLFMLAVEHPEADKSTWAVKSMRLVNNPIWHSDFISNLAQGISQEQRQQGKRVDTRYFSIKHFSSPPPFI